MSGQGFEFTPGGIVALGQPAQAAPEMAPSVVVAPVRAPVANVHAAKPTKQLNVISAVRQRVREIRAELKRLGKLQKELAQLERLLAAADSKPIAPVRAIRHTG